MGTSSSLTPNLQIFLGLFLFLFHLLQYGEGPFVYRKHASASQQLAVIKVFQKKKKKDGNYGGNSVVVLNPKAS